MKVLVINPGSTSTKVALFHRESELWRKSVSHSVEERFPTLDAQLLPGGRPCCGRCARSPASGPRRWGR